MCARISGSFYCAQRARLPAWQMLPAAGLEQVLLLDGGGCEALHGAGDLFACFCEDLWVVEVGCCDYYGAGSGDGFFAFFLVVLYV